MRKALSIPVVLVALGLLIGSAPAAKRSGIEGVVLDTTCYGPCVEGQQGRPYQGEVTVQVRRARKGELVATRKTTDGRFRIKLARGRYDVSASPVGATCPPNAVCKCPPNAPCACPSDVCVAQHGARIVAPCVVGDTERVRVRRHRFTRVELHLSNTCVAQPQQ